MKKNLLIGLGVVASISAPIAATFSCGPNGGKDGNQNLAKSNESQKMADIYNAKYSEALLIKKVEPSKGTVPGGVWSEMPSKLSNSSTNDEFSKGIKDLETWISHAKAFNAEVSKANIATTISVSNDSIHESDLELTYDQTSKSWRHLTFAEQGYEDGEEYALAGCSYETDNNGNIITQNKSLDHMRNLSAKTYNVKARGSNHIVKFVVDNSIHATEEEMKHFINKFLDNTNTGFGWLTLDHVILSTSRIKGNASGMASASKDMIVHMGDLNVRPSYLKTQTWSTSVAQYDQEEMEHKPHTQTDQVEKIIQKEKMTIWQDAFDMVQHEYEHHETMSLFDRMANYQTEHLVDNNVIGSAMFKNISDVIDTSNPYFKSYGKYMPNQTKVATENDRISKAFLTAIQATSGYIQDSNHLNELTAAFSKFYGANNVNHPYNASFHIDMNYHMGVHGEFLNRPMLDIERTNYFDDDVSLATMNASNLYGGPDLLKYQYGESRKLFNDNKTLTTAAKELIDLYGKYVYGYSTYGLKIAKDTYGDTHFNQKQLRGFFDKEFDSVKIFAPDGKLLKIIKVDSIKSHYITKDEMFGETKVANDSYAYSAWLGAEEIPAGSKILMFNGANTVAEDTFENMAPKDLPNF